MSSEHTNGDDFTSSTHVHWRTKNDATQNARNTSTNNKWTSKPLSLWLSLCATSGKCLEKSPFKFVLMIAPPLALCRTMSQLICTNIVQIVPMFITIHYPRITWCCFLSEDAVGTVSTEFTFILLFSFFVGFFVHFSAWNEKLWNFSLLRLSVIVYNVLKCEPQSKIRYVFYICRR